MTRPRACIDLPGALDLADFDYALPPERIAQHPLAERDASKLMLLDRADAAAPPRHLHVRDLPPLLGPDDLLVVNATQVLPARLLGWRESGGGAEALVLGAEGEPGSGRFRALVRISGRLRPGIGLRFSADPGGDRTGPALAAEIREVRDAGEVVLAFAPGVSPYSVGHAPLPPYIRRARTRGSGADDLARYQTVFARVPGAIAAPTAGLHLTERLFDALTDRGVRRAEVVLHVGPGTFRPLSAADLRAHKLHAETYALPESTAAAIAETRARGGRIVAVGTTVARVLETAALPGGRVSPGAGETELFLYPGDRFSVVDALVTNFHLPRSSLLLLVAAFLGHGRVLAAYDEALARGYRFYSYGDAMLIQ